MGKEENLHCAHIIYTVSLSMGVVNLIPHDILFLVGYCKGKVGHDWLQWMCSAPSNIQGLGQQTLLPFDVATLACRGGSICLLSSNFEIFPPKNPKICGNVLQNLDPGTYKFTMYFDKCGTIM